ncbi:MAG: DCC1-like thiol-disulfide oxidoreductase family protein [Pseudomonadota bacterium]
MRSRSTDLVIIYDGDCPFCAAYMKMLRLRDSAGAVSLIDARSDHPEVMRVKQAGIDLQEGMVVNYGSKDYYGDEALTVLSMLSSQSGLLNRISAWIFKSKFRASLLYPPMKLGRAFTLKLLGRKPIT